MVKKTNNLRSAYREELQKVSDSTKSGSSAYEYILPGYGSLSFTSDLSLAFSFLSIS